MSKKIGRIYKHIKYQLSNISTKVPVIYYSASQKSQFIELTITSVSSVTDKKNSVLCSENFIHNDFSITNNDNIQSCETPRKKNYSIKNTSTQNPYAQIIVTMSVSLLNLNTTGKLPPVGKNIIYFQIDGKYDQASKCIKYRIMTKVISCVI